MYVSLIGLTSFPHTTYRVTASRIACFENETAVETFVLELLGLKDRWRDSLMAFLDALLLAEFGVPVIVGPLNMASAG